MKRILRVLPVIAFVFMSASKMWLNSIRSVAARTLGGQQSGSQTTQYLYDSNGRLGLVVLPNGNGIQYTYDAAGNLTSVQSPAPLTVLSFSPITGRPGTLVTFTGVGFSNVTSVSFNGTPATSFSFNPPNLVATVPTGATTGDITLIGSQGNFTTTTPFTVQTAGGGS